MASRQVLRGVTVLALEQAVAAPLCTSRLADAGARVIKVERPGVGDFARAYDSFAQGSSSYFSWLNRGKESLEADIKDPADRALLRDMVADGTVDVFVQNLAPGAAARAGFGSAELRELNPRLVTLDISGYGEEGPRAEYKAYDMLVAAEAGLCSVTGSPEAPGRVGVSICDITCGMNGYAAVLQGLLAREQSGEGASLQVSLFDSAAELMAVPYLQQRYTGSPPARVGLSHPSIAPYGAFATRDGREVVLSVQNEREWAALCGALGLPADDARFASAGARLAHRPALDAAVGAACAALDADALTARLLAAGVAFGEVNPVAGLVAHPQLRTVAFASDRGRPLEAPAPPVRPGPSRLGPVPALGQHSAAIRAERAGRPPAQLS